MIDLIIYDVVTGLISSSIHCNEITADAQTVPDGYAVARILGEVGQYFDASTGAVQDGPLT